MERPRRPATVLAAAVLALVAMPAAAGVNRWTTAGPEAALVSAVAHDPADPSRVFAGTVHGLFRSADGGATWTPANVGFAGLEWITAIAFDPTNAQTLYLGTLAAGTYKSVDGGGSWVSAAAGQSQFFARYGYGLAIDPSAPSTVYVATLEGVYKTTDGGCSWHASNNGLPVVNESFYLQTIAMDPSDPSVLYIGSEFSGPYKSTDGGASWAPLSYPTFFRTSINGFAIDPGKPSTVYMTTSLFDPSASPQATQASTGGVYKSEDGGANWSSLGIGTLPNIPFRSVSLDPGDASVVYAGTIGQGVFRSTDGGQSWAPASSGLADTDVYSLDLPVASHVLAGTRGTGVFRSEDGAASWSPSSKKLLAFQGASLALAGSGGPVFAGGSPYGASVVRSDDAGASWSPANSGIPHVDSVGALVADAGDPDRMYAGTSNFWGIFRSVDGGATWTLGAGSTDSGYHAIVIDPFEATRVYAAGDHGISLSTDSGATWTLYAPFVSIATELVADYSTSGTLFAVDQSVEKSVDGGATWNPAAAGLEGTLVISISQDPVDPSVFLVGTFGGGIYRSTDGGATWTPTSGAAAETAIGSLAFDPSDHSVVYAGVSFWAGYPAPLVPGGVLRSTDGGASWLPFNDGLDEIGSGAFTVSALAVSPTDRRVYAAAIGGVLVWQFSDVPGPAISQLTPASGDASTATPVAVTGSGYDLGATVLVDGQADSSAQVVDATRVNLTLPSGEPGTLSSVEIVNPDTQRVLRRRAFLRDYLDVAESYPFHDDVATLARAGLTAGCGGGSYCPDASLTRAQMAALLERAIHGPDFVYPPPGGIFVDVDACQPPAPQIYQFLRDGLTSGCGPAIFCPDSPVTRAQMAVFLLLAEHGGDYVPPPATGIVFADVHAGDFAADFIEQLAAEGISAGCGGSNFCPVEHASRGQSAALIVRTFDLP